MAKVNAQPKGPEATRLRSLRSYGLLDSATDPDYDRLVKLASELCKTPIAVITLVDDCRQWFKSRIGIDVQETPRAVAFCDHTIRSTEIFEVGDACAGARFSNNPLVTSDPSLRFYAGAPLRSRDGFALGALAVLDHVPRTLTLEQRQILRLLADQVEQLMELSRERNQHRETAEQLREAQQIGAMGSWRYDLKADHLEWSDAVYPIVHRVPEEFDSHFGTFLQWVPEDDHLALLEALGRATSSSRTAPVPTKALLPGPSNSRFQRVSRLSRIPNSQAT